jgi:MFS transporter, LPLT family, lysophospholipid transporter
VQGLYLAAYILASPWVGGFSDFVPKARVLLVGNMIKMLSVTGFFFGLNPALSYGIFGLGSVVYSPAKYGILPFLAHSDKQLMKANSWMEGTTIAAILGGAVVGGFLSDYSIALACVLGLILYLVSIGFTYLIPLNPGTGCMPGRFAIRDFIADIGFFMKHVDARFSVIGSAFFWTVSNILRLAGNRPVSLLMAVIGVGIGIGALLAPRFVSVWTYRRAIFFGIVMGVVVMVLSYVHTLDVAVALIFLIGIMGGLYIVPVNALNEYLGDRTIGTGRATTVQNFAENTFMLFGTGAYTLAEQIDIPIDHTIRWCGLLLLAFMAFLALYRKGNPVAVRGDIE